MAGFGLRNRATKATKAQNDRGISQNGGGPNPPLLLSISRAQGNRALQGSLCLRHQPLFRPPGPPVAPWHPAPPPRPAKRPGRSFALDQNGAEGWRGFASGALWIPSHQTWSLTSGTRAFEKEHVPWALVRWFPNPRLCCFGNLLFCFLNSSPCQRLPLPGSHGRLFEQVSPSPEFQSTAQLVSPVLFGRPYAERAEDTADTIERWFKAGVRYCPFSHSRRNLY